MKTDRLAKLVMWTVIAAAAVAIATLYITRPAMDQRIHTLTQPLMLEGSAQAGHNYLLPTGTTLYFDQAFPEGFVRYRVYVNVDGVDLESTRLADPTEIRPISAYPVDKPALLKLLREYPLSKAELSSVLTAQQLTKQEIRDVLSEFSE